MSNTLKHILFAASLCFSLTNCYSQGKNSIWLFGHWPSSYQKGRIAFSDTSNSVSTEIRKIPMKATQGNIADENGNLLMSSNGIFIANSTGDTMLNGGGLNPNAFTAVRPDGLPLANGNVFLSMPGDSTKYILFHQTGSNTANLASLMINYSIIDITGDGGLGQVISKNNVALSGSFGWGLGACKHANGRDWWVTSFSYNGDTLFKFLLNPFGIQYTGYQKLNVPIYSSYGGQPVFSPDGNKFAFMNFGGPIGATILNVRLFDFDRCTGILSNLTVINIPDTLGGFGIMFSPNSKFLYAASWQKLFQINTDTSNVIASLKLIAINDTFASPQPPFYTDFWHMYLAANGKIYIVSGSGVVDLHYIKYPDSAGLACDVHLHDLNLPVFNFRSYPFHPNYYLGPVIGSLCDSLTTGVNHPEHEFNFSVAPNPNKGVFKIMYLLPQNKSGILNVFDITGREVYNMHLPPWSTLQNLNLSNMPNGLYHATIISDVYRVSKKIVIVN